MGFDATALLAHCGNIASAEDLHPPLPASSVAQPPRRALAAAAALAAAGVVAAIWFETRSPSAYVTERGEQRAISLPDGSLVNLNTDTRLAVEYSPKIRRLVLSKGEALFSVTKDPRRPFIVEAGAHRVQATGTRFSVLEEPARTIVTVVEGSVAVSRTEGQSSPVRLTAGQQWATAHAASGVRSVDAQRAIAWQQWKLYFDDESLGSAVSEFNRYNRQPIVLADPDLSQRKISGVFFANQPDSLLAFIASRDAIEIDAGRDGARIVRLKKDLN